jgi:hypothetical protein
MISDFIITGTDWSPCQFSMQLKYAAERSIGITVLGEFIKDQIFSVAASSSK